MSASANADNDAPVPCANDCGFWGRPSTANYCSTCYKQKVGKVETEKQDSKSGLKSPSSSNVLSNTTLEEKNTDVEVTLATTSTPTLSQCKTKPNEVDSTNLQKSLENPSNFETLKESDNPKDFEEKVVEKKVQKNRMRCFECRKKVGLTGTECRCGYVYCGKHRYPEEHKCEFDFHKLAKAKVATKSKGARVEKLQGEKL